MESEDRRESPGLARLGSEDPFAAPPAERRLDRRLRGRLVAPVTVWTAGTRGERSGLTVSSLLVAEGEPALLLGLLDPLSELHRLAAGSGRFVVHVLGEGDERTARLFAGGYPVDPFEEVTAANDAFGPLLTGTTALVRCRFLESTPAGFQSLVRGEIISSELSASPAPPLVWYRGAFRHLS